MPTLASMVTRHQPFPTLRMVLFRSVPEVETDYASLGHRSGDEIEHGRIVLVRSTID